MLATLDNTLLVLALGFSGYFVLHSLLASLKLKAWVARRWPRLMPAYRLLFNAISILLLLPLLWFLHRHPGPLLWAWPSPWRWLADALALAAVAGFLWSLRDYDSSVFWGWRQWREGHHDIHDPESLHISPLHRFVRHPWYFLFLVIMWTRDLYLHQAVIYGLITLYFVIGARLEEKKLMAHYGEAYGLYRSKVPGLIPLPWRWLRKADVEAILRLAATRPGH